jgi:hypothetical protein
MIVLSLSGNEIVEIVLWFSIVNDAEINGQKLTPIMILI